jgi:DNA (cytosine-5)-methyltransferase 1
MTKFQEWPDADVDVLVGGTPCQSFSVAGLRAGLDDPRGSLMLTYLAVARRYRPTWLVWENVPGVLSSDDGRAFGSLLGGLAELGYGFAYRVLDAQFIRVESHPRAVPQRRRRVFVVGHSGDWRRAAAVLFERESLSGHPAPRREAGQDVAGSLGRRTHNGGMRTTDLDGHGAYIPEVVPQAMSSKWSKGSSGPAGDEIANLVAHSLKADGFDASEDGTGRGTPLVPVVLFDERTVTSPDNRQACRPDHAPTMHESPFAIAFNAYQRTTSDVTGPIQHDDDRKLEKGVIQNMRVRRLTPLECERLQAFPDNYTAIPYRGKAAADGPRYKALGNSMATNVMRWIGERIALVDSLTRDFDVLVGDAEGAATDLDAPSVSEGS